MNMINQGRIIFWFLKNRLLLLSLSICVVASGCTKDYPALIGNKRPATSTTDPTSTSVCSCSTTSGTASTLTVSIPKVDTLPIEPPRLSPNGGTFYFSTTVNLFSDSLPSQGVYEYSLDNGQSWNVGQQFTVAAGGTIKARVRVGDRPSRSRAAAFSIYYQRMLVIGNSIMAHAPYPDIGWYNSNGMAASAPEKDFVHLLTAKLQGLNPSMTYQLQSGGNFELYFGQSMYKMDEFDLPMQTYKPDLVIIRIGENVADGDVPVRQFELQFRQLLNRLISLSEGRAIRIVTTTSVWQKPQADAAIRSVIKEKAWPLADLQCMVGQGQYFASQYTNPGVAAHPNDLGMQKITDLLWAQIQ